MINPTKIRNELICEKRSIDDLIYINDELDTLRTSILSGKTADMEICHDLIMLYKDFYTYSKSGDALIPDHDYDLLMNHYISMGGSEFIYSDILKDTSRWNFVQHECPGIVGSVKKIYTEEELMKYIFEGPGSYAESYIISPKFDGVSSAVKIDSDGKVLLAVTRNDGVRGQDITEVIRKSMNIEAISFTCKQKLRSGEFMWVKTEVCMSTDQFNLLLEEKTYKNRRSAVSGIVNSPKNLSLARFLTVIPLACYNPQNDEIDYRPSYSEEFSFNGQNIFDIRKRLMKYIESMFSFIRDSHFPFRTDGVVIYPISNSLLPNFDDIMDHAIAFKVNTSEALTQVEYGYVSIGRLGNAVPMIHVYPTEINEICAHDASLGSFDKFVGMDIHEGEQVIIYAGGDVIPLVRLPENRHYPANAPLLQIKKKCPYCGEKLTRHKNSYRCENSSCTRVISGKIVNFVSKMDMFGISDATIEDFCNAGIIQIIPDLFRLTKSDIMQLDRYGEAKADNILKEINDLQNREVCTSRLLGSLGIPGISEKTAHIMLQEVSLMKLLKMKTKKAIFKLMDVDRIGETTARTFVKFIHDNRELILELMDFMTIVADPSWKGNVVFTGFRNPSLEKRFNSMGYEVSSNVNKHTVAVIDSSYTHDSSKCKAAESKGIDIVHISDVDDVLMELKRRR